MDRRLAVVVALGLLMAAPHGVSPEQGCVNTLNVVDECGDTMTGDLVMSGPGRSVAFNGRNLNSTVAGVLRFDGTDLQFRVTGTCAAGSSIRAVNADGSVTCEADDDSGGDITEVLAGTGLSGGGASGAVTLGIATGGVTSAMVADGTLVAADADPASLQLRVNGTCAVGQAIRAIASDGTVTCESGPGWLLTGNAGTTPGTHFVGTTDERALEFKVNNVRALRLEPVGTSVPNLIGGAGSNSVASGINGAVIGGGSGNNVSAHHGTIAGGTANRIEADPAGDNFVTIGGGASNVARKGASTVAGGNGNQAVFFYTTVGGGSSNWATNSYATIAGGSSNRADGVGSFVGAGLGNLAQGSRAVVAGGDANWAGTRAAIGGGQGNTALGDFTVIAGGLNNLAPGQGATVAGGQANQAGAAQATVGGGAGNKAGGVASTVAGGNGNNASANNAAIGGGINHLASGAHATIAGGNGNTASNTQATVGGGLSNTASGSGAVVAGGQSHLASGTGAAIGGGQGNTASGQQATVAGGNSNTASGDLATIPGGYLNTATAANTFAAGRQAQAGHGGAFVWADGAGFAFPSTAANEFSARATGGVRFVSAVDGTGNPTAGVALAPGSGTWSSLSDRGAKEGFAAVDPREVLAKVAALPVTTWSYRTEPGVLHMGPTAQDFRAAFGLGPGATTITTVDADGVALAAIQGLHQQLSEERARNDALEARLAALEALVLAR